MMPSRTAWVLLWLATLACGRPVPRDADTLTAHAVEANARERRAAAADAPASPSPALSPRSQAAPGRGPGFRSRRQLDEHFAKHGREFGDISRSDYLRLAQALRDTPIGRDVLEIVRDDGTTSRFERSTGSFLAFNPDRSIRTFFKPNDGEAYFRRQARRRPNR